MHVSHPNRFSLEFSIVRYLPSWTGRQTFVHFVFFFFLSLYCFLSFLSIRNERIRTMKTKNDEKQKANVKLEIENIQPVITFARACALLRPKMKRDGTLKTECDVRHSVGEQ